MPLTVFARKLLWLLLCLVAGGPCAFLALEGIGVPLVVLALAGVVWVGRRRQMLGETLLAFGLPYSVEIVRIAIPEAISWFQQGDALNGIYFVAHLLVAVAIVLIGCRQLLARRQPRQAV